MYEGFGAVVDGNRVEFRLFFPDRQVDATQYVRGGDPHIEAIRVTGDFQSHLGADNWDFSRAPLMQRQDHPNGWLYTFAIDPIPDGFYQYKYFVTFQNGTTRWCGDPCTKYGGAEFENSAFVVGGNSTVVQPIANRQPLQDLVLYEMMIDDFTAGYRGDRAPIDAIADQIPHLEELGINAIEFMPWTAWPGNAFSWGYDPFSFFSVEHRYTHDNDTPLDKLYKLQTLINTLHGKGIHVIMDGVFNHVNAGLTPDRGFPYLWLYQNPEDSPYIGSFEGGGFFNDLDYGNRCTEQFIFDVCKYWLDEFQIDGIRFDYALGFFRPADPQEGIARLVADLEDYVNAQGRQNVSFILELLTDNRFEAINATNRIGATGCWFDPLMFQADDTAAWGQVSTRWMRCLNTSEDFAPGRAPVTYIENHDHSTIAHRADDRRRWWRTQPLAAALLLSPGASMIHNGQEFGDNYGIPEDGDGRVQPRPIHWELRDDPEGKTLFNLYRKLIRLRKEHPALRSANFYPQFYDDGMTHWNDQGYGVDVDRDVLIFHRWGNGTDGQLERFMIVLNMSDYHQWVDIPFADNGDWQELLEGGTAHVTDYWLRGQEVNSNWGLIYYRRG
jgi:pullulanase